MPSRRIAAAAVLAGALVAAGAAAGLPARLPRAHGRVPAAETGGTTLAESASGTAAAAPSPVPAKAVAITPYPPPAQLGGRDWLYFPETGHYVAGGFKAYFERNGGLDGLGYPITEELVEDGWTVQYFQRARLEYHPQSPAAPVQRSLLGDMLLAAAPERRPVRPVPGNGPPPGARAFPETGHAVAPPALEFFDRNGGLAALGYPISDAAGGMQWFQRARLEWQGGPVQAALIGDEYAEAAGLAYARARAQPPTVARTTTANSLDGEAVYAAPGSSDVATRLPQDAQLRVTGEAHTADGRLWYAVYVWNAVPGYVRGEALAFTAAPPKPAAAGAAAAPWRPDHPPAQGPFVLALSGSVAAERPLAAVPGGPSAGSVPAGSAVQVSAWATDPPGRVWYAITGGGSSGWLPAQHLAVQATDPAWATAGGRPVSERVTGKGMWFTYDVLRQTPVAHLVSTARANGLSFLAPQVGTSRRGYWARGELDALLPAAHAAGLRVIPWVYTWLADVPADVQLAVRAAQHVAPSGDRVDGLGVDLEENLDEATVRAFGQVLRAGVGPDALLVAITYQPQNVPGQRTPFGAIAESFDVIAPMSYWHLRDRPHTEREAYDYVAESIRLVRQRAGRTDVPVAVLGQTFDWFSRNEIGPGNPSGAEVRGAIQAARDLGALGIGFFNWYSTTPEEWDAIAAFPW